MFIKYQPVSLIIRDMRGKNFAFTLLMDDANAPFLPKFAKR